MAITRAQAQALLSAPEMQLYDESRSNALRKLDAVALQKRVERARRSRDRARDLVKRHKLALREATGSKRGRAGEANQRSKAKAELLGDILKRFEAGLKAAGKPAAARPAKASTRAGASAKAPRAVSRVALRRKAEDAVADSSAPARKAATKKTAAAKKRSQAVAAKRKLLEKKTARDRAPKEWQALDEAPVAATAAAAGFQSASAASKAKRLHAGQSRMKPIQGSIGSRVRRNQAKRDGR
jgi:hypothetical protein